MVGMSLFMCPNERPNEKVQFLQSLKNDDIPPLLFFHITFFKHS